MLDNCFRFAPRDSIPGLIAKICKYLKDHPGWSEAELENQIKQFIGQNGVDSFNGRNGAVVLNEDDVNNLKIASAYFAEGNETIDKLDLVSLYNQGVRFVFTDFNSVTSGYNLAFVLDYFDASGEVVYYPVSTGSGGGGNIVSVNGKTGEVHLKVVDVSSGNSPDENAYIFIDESDDYPDVISSDSSKLGGQLPSYYASAEDVSTLKDDLGKVDSRLSESITDIDTELFERYPQLYDYDSDNIITGRISASTGIVDTANTGFSTSDFVKISGGKRMYISGAYGDHDNLLVTLNNVAVFDSNKNVITGISWNSATVGQGKTAELPSNAKFIRLSIIGGTHSRFKYVGMFYDGYHSNLADFTYKAPTLKPIVNRAEKADVAEYSNKVRSKWSGKTGLLYGDSITAITNPNSPVNTWGNYVKNFLELDTLYARGVGSQKYGWGNGGGSVVFVRENGEYNSRNDSYNKDNYTDSIPAGCTATRGSFCSWDRITHMIPSSIKDTIDFIYIMGGTNDGGGGWDTEVAWVDGDTTDTEWANSEYYSRYGGDYNIYYLMGGLASCIMKMQAWCPNAQIIVGTPLSGRGNTGEINKTVVVAEYNKSLLVKKMAALLSVPCVDVNGTTGINGWNRAEYISDIVHPYPEKGQKALARVVANGINQILPQNIFD